MHYSVYNTADFWPVVDDGYFSRIMRGLSREILLHFSSSLGLHTLFTATVAAINNASPSLIIIMYHHTNIGQEIKTITKRQPQGNRNTPWIWCLSKCRIGKCHIWNSRCWWNWYRGHSGEFDYSVWDYTAYTYWECLIIKWGMGDDNVIIIMVHND